MRKANVQRPFVFSYTILIPLFFSVIVVLVWPALNEGFSDPEAMAMIEEILEKCNVKQTA